MGLGKILIILGIVFIIAGIVVWSFLNGMFLGKLPGDVFLKRKNISIFFPVVTCLILSVLFTLFLNLIFWIFRKF